MPKIRLPIKNMILAALHRTDYQRLLPDLEYISLPLDVSLYQSGDLIEYVYFPGDGLVSLVTHMKDGTSIEVGLIGRDGMVGIPVLLGDDIAFEEAIVQIAGSAMRMRSDVFKEGLKTNHNPLLRELLLYTRSLMKQVAQTAACNRLHTVEERLSRWLLMSHDRMESDELPLKQEFLSNMLGTRRASVGVAATGLQAQGLIRYSRGHISILKRKELEEFACECYRAVDGEADRHPTGPQVNGHYAR
ncbi:MAG TPA: Crp/Fnr family transcriptional regulator [Pyrinomonadaceae bacterium]|nr:Crp/Fnr family transcriptional regulator [Pyrinomonadaceae bacterium]